MTRRQPSASLRARPLALLPLLLSLLLVPFMLGACGKRADTPALPAERGAVVLGIDACDWQVLEPLIAAGEAPNFARLRDQSASGVCLSFIPLRKSPEIWASIATGLEPHRHGTSSFIATALWGAPALWDIAGAADLRSCVIGWLVTFPAREIQGVMVSNHVSFTEAGNRRREGLVRPEALTDELSALTVDYREIPPDMLRIMLPNADSEMLADPDNRKLRILRLALAGDLTYLATAEHLLAGDRFDLFCLYLRGLDTVCHHYWKYYNPGDGPPTDAADRELYGQIIPGYYKMLDTWLGDLLPRLPTEANLIVVSDHGFYGPRRSRSGAEISGVGEHRAEGVLIVRSPLYVPGTRFDSTFVLNVAPTALALLGLPSSREMEGRVLRDGLTAPAAAYVEHLEGNRIASYASLAPTQAPEIEDDPAVTEAMRRQLRSLGYVD